MSASRSAKLLFSITTIRRMAPCSPHCDIHAKRSLRNTRSYLMPRWAVNQHHLTPEAAARGRQNQGLTRKWYKETLLGIFKGEIKCNSSQLNALKAFADLRGWYPPERPKSRKIKGDRSKFKPQASEDVLNRLSAFNVATLPNITDLQKI